MIDYKHDEDWDGLYQLCSISHPASERWFIEYLFDNYYHQIDGIVDSEDDKIIACLFQEEHALTFNQKILLVNWIFQIATHPDYRRRGHMDYLLEHQLRVSEANYLISFMEVYNPRIFKKYGFEEITHRKRFSIASKEIPVLNAKGVSFADDPEELEAIYQEYIKHFDCHYLRDVNYYLHYLQQIKANDGKIAIYRKGGIAKGYCIYFERDDLIEVKEMVYLDAITLYKLLRFAIGLSAFISLEVSEGEKVETLFKRGMPRQATCIMARVNNLALFNKLYGCEVKNTSEAFNILKKPINLNEKH